MEHKKFKQKKIRLVRRVLHLSTVYNDYLYLYILHHFYFKTVWYQLMHHECFRFILFLPHLQFARCFFVKTSRRSNRAACHRTTWGACAGTCRLFTCLCDGGRATVCWAMRLTYYGGQANRWTFVSITFDYD